MDKKVVQKFQHSRVPFSRNTAVFRKELANRKQKFKSSTMGLRPRASVFNITKSKFISTSGKNESSRKYLGSIGNTGIVEERSNSKQK